MALAPFPAEAGVNYQCLEDLGRKNKGWTPLSWQKLSNLYVLVKEGWVFGE